MKIERALRITSKIALVAAIALAIVGLAFRCFVWASWLPYGDDPYGAADILELLILFLMVASSGICVLCGIGLLFGQPRTIRFLAAGIIVPVIYALLHPLVPVFQLW